MSNDARDDVPELRRRIAEDGYLFFRDFFGREETLGARREVVNWLDGGGLLDRGRPVLAAVAAAHASTRIEPEAGKFPSVRRLMHGGRIMQFYERFLGGTARAYDHIWLRVPSPGQVTGPHCDIIYMGRGTTNLYTS
ncbi:MAG: phytanoyl-CoA dioxygenase, partial [Deltaproteobacteria bacterium]|nr:phytanoyl-CoA dioxygenase [Deltaproteobacteria bacterium]